MSLMPVPQMYQLVEMLSVKTWPQLICGVLPAVTSFAVLENAVLSVGTTELTYSVFVTWATSRGTDVSDWWLLGVAALAIPVPTPSTSAPTAASNVSDDAAYFWNLMLISCRYRRRFRLLLTGSLTRAPPGRGRLTPFHQAGCCGYKYPLGRPHPARQLLRQAQGEG